MSYELEFDITNLLRELLRVPLSTSGTTPDNGVGSHTSSTYDTSANNITHADTEEPEEAAASDGVQDTETRVAHNRVFIDMMQRNQNTLDELIYRYNLQMDRYNQNMETFIRLLQSTQTRIHQYMMSSPTQIHPQSNAFSSMRLNSSREDANIVLAMLNNPIYRMGGTSLIYSYLFPRREGGINGTNTGARLSPQQRAASIRNIRYSQDSMRDNICPISLSSFTEGEDVSQIIHCGHVFKPDSLDQWLSYSTCCPVCRYNIVGGPTVPSSL